MEKLYSLALLFFVATFYSQENNTNSFKKIGFEVTAKFGTSKLDYKNAVDLNGNSSAGDFLFVYRLNKNNVLKSGITLSEFNANFTSANQTAALKNSYLQVPLKYFYHTPLSNSETTKIDMVFGLGVTANNLYKSTTETALANTSNKNIGWNFGSTFDMGIDISMSNYMNFGIYYEALSDFNRIDKNASNQKLSGTNLVKFSYILNF